MKLHEYQGKEILASFGIPVSSGVVASTVEEAVAGAQGLYSNHTGEEVYVIKAQVHAGGRGKAGGVKIVKGLEAAREAVKNMLGMKLVTPQTGAEGKIVHKVYITPDAFYPGESKPQEFYLSITLDRSKECDVIIACAEGGVEIEEVAEKYPEKILREWVNPRYGLLPFQARRIALGLGLGGEAFKNAVNFILQLYEVYLKTDASMIEINPMLKTSDNKIIALDCKYALDENALYRHAEYHHYRDVTEEEPLETEAKAYGLNYVKLNGNVGCMVNGAGLAMATMDMIKLSGGEPANFLDVGGGATAQTVEAGFRIILKDPSVKAILINIFGGIVQCDRVANGVVEAYKNIGEIPVPIIVRLQGTNAEKAAEIIKASGLKVIPAIELREAALRVQEALRQN
ncbi:MAG: ADP-forming succinate--CoA ligase subunit beta [Bacteroidia bacterium]|nr:ADP-forming succinate--CoA ligase subunit beta [Bacteroidia bacterium]MDW8159703.1 ADP-forming succinate--CoA ligase subunit beta [Bacteroidia bacterium]